ncbi:hypothetical protein GCM10012320_14940 [Sinomonas cellulolyticus]|nr:hypothetical protein GCM10012320_14940 [Sinomonas sp. KCTC 49339]
MPRRPVAAGCQWTVRRAAAAGGGGNLPEAMECLRQDVAGNPSGRRVAPRVERAEGGFDLEEFLGGADRCREGIRVRR